MTKEQIQVPATGSDGEMEVIEISVEAGESIEQDQTIVVLESDKATIEVPATKAGKVEALQIKLGDKVKEGHVLLTLVCDDEAPGVKEKNITDTEKRQAEPATRSTKTETEAKAGKELEQDSQEEGSGQQNKNVAKKAASETLVVLDDLAEGAEVHAGPAVRKFAREHGVDLLRVAPTGPKSRILQEDVSNYIKNQVGLVQGSRFDHEHQPFGMQTALPDFKQFGEVSISAMSRIHIKTAENMQRSLSIPHVTQFDEADISEMEAFRQSQKKLAEAKGVKLTPMSFLLKACAYVLKTMPQFNVSIDLAQQQLVQKHYIHIGFAVDTRQGLLVPVIRDVDKKGLWQLAEECQDLAARARDRKLKPAEMQGACFTITSLGSIGGTAFTPIINSPEVAILGVSKAQMKPVYDQDGSLQARLMLPLSLSYDHRAVNGADGARFTSLLSKVLVDLRELLL